ncbi:MAG: amylo-alpha-1,6-glucosidase [Chlorobi bacterium]|nr:amylo-alpha-1,6-glucosidase [Chlorobiota bacterium]
MSYLKFDKGQLINLEYCLNKEILRTNRAGSYICTTLNDCNTRKYHGLLVSPIEEFNGEKHVLLSSLDATVIQHGAEFNLGVRRYQGGYYEPKGHKYIHDLEFGNIPKTTYRIGGLVLSRERLLVEQEQQVLIRYTLEEAHSPTTLRLKPFLAFRSIHQLSKANLFVQSKYETVEKGIKMRLYDGYPYLHMQFSKEAEFIPVPDWYYNIEYIKERNRGYECLEDLYVPGYFELPIKKGESIVFAASTKKVNPGSLKQRFTKELKKRVERDTFTGSLNNSARQFIKYSGNETDIVAGFPWYGSITRQTFIALPGLYRAFGNTDTYVSVLNTYKKHLREGRFPKSIEDEVPNYDTADAPLWFIWAIQQYKKQLKTEAPVWKQYGKAIKSILDGYKNNRSDKIKMQANGLIYNGGQGVALTWIDSSVDGVPVVQRDGLAVEINALWYNAVCFALEIASAANDKKFVNEWEGLPEKIAESFNATFWDGEKEYLADHVNEGYADWSVRPNMLLAAALDYSPISKEQQKAVLSIVKKQLLTPRGIRSLSPEHPNYKSVVEGNHHERELAIHQGAAHPWLLQFFVEGYLKIHKSGGLSYVKKLVESFKEEMTEHCIGTISEMYNGNPPHQAKGAISQAWSVASVLNACDKVESFEYN